MREDAKLWAATKWIRQNKQQLRGRVLEPMRLLVGVKDRKYAKHAEAAIKYGTFKTIVASEKADFDKLADIFTRFPAQQGTMNLKVNLAVLPPGTTLQNFQPPCSRAEVCMFVKVEMLSVLTELSSSMHSALMLSCLTFSMAQRKPWPSSAKMPTFTVL